MKSNTAIAVTLFILATAATVRDCTQGPNYCGYGLLHIGDYQSQIYQALYVGEQPLVDGGRDDLFYCVGGYGGVITFVENCGGKAYCKDGGNGRSDFCGGPPDPSSQNGDG
ncbi:hypothetical protein MMC12_003464 [Toensbergia leucococca]|nr:hypothetical protein [Toensbergia leucococca]